MRIEMVFEHFSKQLLDYLQKKLEITPELTDVDLYCRERYDLVDNKAYKNKRKVFGKYVTVFLNELITPNAYEVLKVKKDLNLKDKDIYDKAVIIGNKIAYLLKWTSDKDMHNSNDFYTFPNEDLVIRKTDCEGHAFTVASFDRNISVAYGFYNEKGYSGDSRGVGHAFNVFIWNDSLYILETTGNVAQIHKYNPKDDKEQYNIRFIVTPTRTYQLEYGVEFGDIAGWD